MSPSLHGPTESTVTVPRRTGIDDADPVLVPVAVPATGTNTESAVMKSGGKRQRCAEYSEAVHRIRSVVWRHLIWSDYDDTIIGPYVDNNVM